MSNSPGPKRALIRCARAPVRIAFLLIRRSNESRNHGGARWKQQGLGWLPAIPIQITCRRGCRLRRQRCPSSSGQGSLFTRENVVLTYDRPGERTQFFLLGVGRFSQYFDVTGQNETAGNVTLSLTHNFSTRLSFYASVYGTYQNEPNFQSNVGPQNVRALTSTRSIFFRLLTIGFATFHRNKLHVRARSVLFLVEREFSERFSEHVCSEPCSEHV